MSKFFIHRPIFAWVIAIFVIIAGVISITKLPVAQFPSVAPPTINVTATYPGATSQTMTDSVLQLIEREINGAQGLMYMEASAPAGGQGTLTVTFAPAPTPIWHRWTCKTASRACCPACLRWFRPWAYAWTSP